jgi:hypothetical protein
MPKGVLCDRKLVRSFCATARIPCLIASSSSLSISEEETFPFSVLSPVVWWVGFWRCSVRGEYQSVRSARRASAPGHPLHARSPALLPSCELDAIALGTEETYQNGPQACLLQGSRNYSGLDLEKIISLYGRDGVFS